MKLDKKKVKKIAKEHGESLIKALADCRSICPSTFGLENSCNKDGVYYDCEGCWTNALKEEDKC